MHGLLKYMQYALIAALLMCCPRFAHAAPSFAGEANPYATVQWFDWKEFGSNNGRLVRESGLRYGLGFTYNFEFFEHHLILKPRIEIVGGRVDYDGATQAGVPVKTDTDYYSGKVELDLGWRIGSLTRASIEPFGGIAFNGWSRDIKDATASNGTQAIGYEEAWYTAYARLGVRGNVALGEKTQLFVEAGGKFPFYTQNTAYLSDAGGSDITLKPKNEASWFAEAGIKMYYFKASFFYDSMRFGASDVVYSGSVGYYQPKSQADIFGIRIGASL